MLEACACRCYSVKKSAFHLAHTVYPPLELVKEAWSGQKNEKLHSQWAVKIIVQATNNATVCE